MTIEHELRDRQATTADELLQHWAKLSSPRAEEIEGLRAVYPDHDPCNCDVHNWRCPNGEAAPIPKHVNRDCSAQK